MAIARILLPILVMAASVVVAGGSSALLIVDVQNCFTSGGSLAVPDGDAVVPVINGLREDYGQYFDAVVLSQDWHCPDHVSFASQHPGRNPFDQVDLTYRLSTGELCAKDGSDGTAYAVDCSGTPSNDILHLTQVLWPDHCVINRMDSLFHSQLNVLPMDLIVRKGYRCHIDSYSVFYDNGKMTHTELHELLSKRGITTLYVVGLATDYCVYYSAKDASALGYKTYVVLDGTRGISKATVDTAIADMKQSGIEIINSADVAATFTKVACG